MVLPGYSIKNKDWAIQAAKEVKLSHDVRPVFWDHWEDPDKVFNAKDKADDVVDILLDDTANIIAKSISTLVASYMIEKIPTRINKVIFCGMPLNDMREENKEVIKQALRVFPPEKIICFQNDEDPYGSFDEAKDFILTAAPDIQVFSRPRDDHEYPYFHEFERFLKN